MQLIVFFECDWLHKFLLILQASIKIIIELINFIHDFSFQFLEIILDDCQSFFNIAPIFLSVGQMFSKLLGQFRKNIFHFAVFFGHNIDNFLHLRINIMTQLSCPLWGLISNIPNGQIQFLIGSRDSFLDSIEIIDQLIGNITCEFLQINFWIDSNLHFLFNQFPYTLKHISLVCFVKIILLSETFLNSFHFCSEKHLLLFPVASLNIDLFHDIFYLTFKKSWQLPDTLLFPLELISNQHIHVLIPGPKLLFVRVLFLLIYSFS